jgi:hypothetical protein
MRWIKGRKKLTESVATQNVYTEKSKRKNIRREVLQHLDVNLILKNRV